MYPWTFVATDLGGNQLEFGEVINPDGRRVAGGLKRPTTLNFTLAVENPLFKEIRDQDYDVLIKAYYGASLRAHVPLTNYQRVSEAGKRTVMFTGADPYGFRFPKRHLNRVAAITPLTPSSRGGLAKAQIDANAADQGEHGVRTGVQPFAAGGVVTYNMSPFKPLNEFIAEMAAGDSGFEWRLLPIEFTDGKYADWISADRIGSTKPDVIFEHNMGANNIVRAEELGDLTTAANDVFHIAETGPDAPGAPVVEGLNLSSIARRGVLSDIASAQLVDEELRQALVNDHATLRGGWRRVFSFSPAVYDADHPTRVPQLGVDYDIGDTVRARATDDPHDPGAVWFDGWVRVWAVEDAPDKFGKITRTLTLVEDAA